MKIDIEKLRNLPPDIRKDALRLYIQSIEKKKEETSHSDFLSFVKHVWPEFIEEKDVNDMVLNGFSPDEIQDIIDKHTAVNLRAKMEFVNWKKV